MLVVFVRFPDDSEYLGNWWLEDDDPHILNTIIDPNTSVNSTNKYNLTHFFKEMSLTDYDVVHDVEIHTENGNIYLCLNSKFAVSIDEGETWSAVDNFENEEGEKISAGCSSAEINPANPDEIFLSGSTMIYSKDAGETWGVIPEPDRNTILDFHRDWERRILYASLLDPDVGVYEFNF